ncbi:MAG TPA: hypothetical protein VE377_02900 [Candidatus Dormibacteraeota bacterium]|nr:hypothetical protein [Candidatus Dormibacteraeota bacterium]
MQRSPSLSSTNQLIAQAYTEQRPFEWRFPDARYGPVRQRRGAPDPRMDESPALLEAESSIAHALAKHPDDPGWLQAKARTELLEGNYGVAIEALTRAESSSSADESLQLDLAIAYGERARSQTNRSSQFADYDRALQLLNQILARNPNNEVALFNRAVVNEQMNKRAEAVSDWERYLKLDSEGAWVDEAKKKIGNAR